MQQYFSNKKIDKQATMILTKEIFQGSVLHYRYLFYSCLVNYRENTTFLHKNLISIYEQKALIFSSQ